MKLKIYLTKLLYNLSIFNRIRWNKTYPEDKKIHIYKNIRYSENYGRKNKLDIFVAEEASENQPVIIHIHGGGWTVGDKKDVLGYCKYLATKGYTTVAINYNLAPKTAHPDQEQNVLEAIKWIYENIEKYKGDAKNIILSGDSGGAYLAAVVATVCTNETYAKLYNLVRPEYADFIKGMILFYGVYDFRTAVNSEFPLLDISYNAFLGTVDVESHMDLMNEASVIDYITENFPKSIVISSEIDPLHNSQSVEFVKKAKLIGINVIDVFFDQTYTDAQHGFLYDYKRTCTKESMNSILKFLENNE